MDSPPRELVIGGSVGGLLAANLLHRAGCDVTVFERAEEDLAGRGAGISAHHGLLAIIRRICPEIDQSIGVEVGTRICLDRSGRITHQTELPQFMSAWGQCRLWSYYVEKLQNLLTSKSCGGALQSATPSRNRARID